jgi:hypothetical protein
MAAFERPLKSRIGLTFSPARVADDIRDLAKSTPRPRNGRPRMEVDRLLQVAGQTKDSVGSRVAAVFGFGARAGPRNDEK